MLQVRKRGLSQETQMGHESHQRHLSQRDRLGSSKGPLPPDAGIDGKWHKKAWVCRCRSSLDTFHGVPERRGEGRRIAVLTRTRSRSASPRANCSSHQEVQESIRKLCRSSGRGHAHTKKNCARLEALSQGIKRQIPGVHGRAVSSIDVRVATTLPVARRWGAAVQDRGKSTTVTNGDGQKRFSPSSMHHGTQILRRTRSRSASPPRNSLHESLSEDEPVQRATAHDTETVDAIAQTRIPPASRSSPQRSTDVLTESMDATTSLFHPLNEPYLKAVKDKTATGYHQERRNGSDIASIRKFWSSDFDLSPMARPKTRTSVRVGTQLQRPWSRKSELGKAQSDILPGMCNLVMTVGGVQFKGALGLKGTGVSLSGRDIEEERMRLAVSVREDKQWTKAWESSRPCTSSWRCFTAASCPPASTNPDFSASGARDQSPHIRRAREELKDATQILMCLGLGESGHTNRQTAELKDYSSDSTPPSSAASSTLTSSTQFQPMLAHLEDWSDFCNASPTAAVKRQLEQEEWNRGPTGARSHKSWGW